MTTFAASRGGARRPSERYALLVAMLLAAVAGCSSDPDPLTQIEVSIDSDLDVPGELDRVTIAVSGMVTEAPASADLRERDLPRHLTLVHRGGKLGPVRITATGWHGRAQVVERVVQTRFQSGESVEVAIDLARACVSVDCPSGSSCDDGQCVAIADGKPIDTPDGGGTGDAGGEDGGPDDAGSDSGVDDAGMNDAGNDAGPDDAGSDAGSDAGDSGPPPNRAPACTITMPLATAALTAGQTLRLAGRCDDPETGRVRIGLSWRSDREGMLCNGAMCDAVLTMPGAHAISLCAPDPVAPGNMALRGCASVTVNVALPEPPTVSIDSATQSGSSAQPFDTGPAIVLSASADGQDLTLVWRDTLIGEFGGGAVQAQLNSPLVGRHIVTLTATDNVGQVRQASVTFVVLAQNANALVQPFATANGVLATAGSSRIDALASDSLDHGVLATSVAGAATVYMLDGSNPNTGGLSLESSAPTVPDLVRSIAISEVDDLIYLATGAGLTVCDYAASMGITGGCSTHKNGNFPSNSLSAVLRANAGGTGYLAVGTQRGLLVSTTVSGSNNGATSFDDVAIAGLAAGDGDELWVATAGEGLWRYELESEDTHMIDGAPSLQLTAVAVDEGGAVWVGSDEGVGRYEPQNDTWLLASVDASPEPHLASDTIRCLAATRALIDGDPHDLIWVGTNEGITRIDSSIGTLMNLTAADGLPSASVRAIVVLGDGSKLIATDAGLARYAGP